MNLHLFSHRHSCNELGICQRTGPACRKACQMATTAEPPLGHEAAHASNVHQLHAGRRAAERALAAGANRDEEADRPSASWAVASRLYAGALLLLALLAGSVYSLLTPGSWLHELGWAAMSLAG